MWMKQSAGVWLISTIKLKPITLDYQPVRIVLSFCLSLLLRIFLFLLLCPYVLVFLPPLFSGFSSYSCLVADGLSGLDARFQVNGNGVGLRLTFLNSCIVILSTKGENGLFQDRCVRRTATNTGTGLLWWTDLHRCPNKSLFSPGFRLWRGFSFYEALSYRLRAVSTQCPRWHCQIAQTFVWLVFWLQIGEKVISIGALWTRHTYSNQALQIC